MIQEELTKDLLRAGVHFGHQTRRWNPKMKKYIFTSRNGIYIIDLRKTVECLIRAKKKVRECVEGGESVLFVGTKKQARSIIIEEAQRCGAFYVSERWLGGMLTNFQTIRKSLDRLRDLERMKEDGTYDQLPKKEVISLERRREKLLRTLGGIKDLFRPPGLLYVVDAKREKIAVAEANKLGIPVVAIVDTNTDPDPVEFPVPGNDDAIKSIRFITRYMADVIEETSEKHTSSEDSSKDARRRRKKKATVGEEG